MEIRDLRECIFGFEQENIEIMYENRWYEIYDKNLGEIAKSSQNKKY